MARSSKTKTILETAPVDTPSLGSRPRLHKLIIKNFRCIGSQPVEIELDDIVVLVGPNNAGKSSILRAYEVVMSHGSNEGHLSLDDFPNSKINQDALPEIELQTVVFDNSPGERWIREINGEKFVRERWVWSNPGAGKRQGFDIQKNDWDDEVPWGAPNVANSRRPQPHRVDAFSDPQTQTKEIVDLLMSILNERVKLLQTIKSEEESEETDYSLLLRKIQEIQTKIVEESQEEIQKVETEVSTIVEKVFPNYKIRFNARPEEDIEKSINLFKTNPQLLMGPVDGYQSTIERQGSGARRTLLWAALRYISETGSGKSTGRKNAVKKDTSSSTQRPHVLLLDEPELCLHPNAIREACKVLYDLPQSGNWQVMVTTHSPAFIDLSRNNTTIIRVERGKGGEINGTTLFRPDRAKLDDDDKQRLKLLNVCDPYVAEFFFGGRIVIVEGDTEYTAFKYVVSQKPERFNDVHIIRARGKATIVSLIKILNHFGTQYSVLHDSDTPLTKEFKKNSAWATNQNILDAINLHKDKTKIRLAASVPNLEKAFFQKEVKNEKPYNALMKMSEDATSFKLIEELLAALIDHTKPTPVGCLEWTNLKELEDAVGKEAAFSEISSTGKEVAAGEGKLED
ncbi:ATP-dependent endonuclease [Paenibacillus sp. 32352]|uniref:ATP-dependent nuclease n=1 Tax=Paenibacillus sp. 32352 TaxID=1969111 RepID=UPI0009AED848|nr:AAA family ATPase [Paenibacillus sp. 32352]